MPSHDEDTRSSTTTNRTGSATWPRRVCCSGRGKRDTAGTRGTPASHSGCLRVFGPETNAATRVDGVDDGDNRSSRGHEWGAVINLWWGVEQGQEWCFRLVVPSEAPLGALSKSTLSENSTQEAAETRPRTDNVKALERCRHGKGMADTQKRSIYSRFDSTAEDILHRAASLPEIDRTERMRSTRKRNRFGRSTVVANGYVGHKHQGQCMQEETLV